MKSRCVHLNQELSNLLPATISTSVHLKLLIILFFHPCSMSSSFLLLQVSQHIVICQVASLHQLLHLPECQVHRHYFVSGITVLLSCCLNSCNVFLFMPYYYVTYT